MPNNTDDVVARVSSVRPYETTAAATPDNRAGFQVWDFAPGSTEFAYADGRMRGWDDSTSIKVRFAWFASTAVADDVRWEVAFWRLADGGDDVDAGWNGAAPQGILSTAPGTCGDPKYVEIEFASGEINGVLNGELFRIRIYRDHDYTENGNEDDMAGDAELIADSFEIVAA